MNTSERESAATFKAFLIAPFAAALFATVVFGSQIGLQKGEISFLLVTMLVFTYPATVFLVLPIYLLLRGRIRPSLPICALFGGSIGAIATLSFFSVVAVEPLRYSTFLRSPFFLLGVASGVFGAITFWALVPDGRVRRVSQ